MQRNRLSIVVGLAAMVLDAFVTAAITSADDEVRGMIMSRTGQTLIVTSGDSRTTVALTASTRVEVDRGLFGLDKEEMADTLLIPGLKVVVDGSSDGQGPFVAETITVDRNDLETSEMIQAGLHPTARQVAANVAAIETPEQKITQSQLDIAANQQAIGANKKAIAEHTRKVDQNIKDIPENTDRFNRLGDFNVRRLWK